MGQLMLGLPQDQFDSLANNVDAICHSAALVDWMRPLEDYVRPNIVSTHELLRLASTGRSKTIHLVSTVSTLTKHLGYEMLEDEREYGYATSKWTAEKMLDSARWRGARTSVYRLPFVTAAASTGHFRNDRGDFLHNLFAGCIQMGWFPNIDADLSAVLAVDYLGDTIVAIMTQNRTWIGRDFDFLNADAPTFCEFSKLMGAASQGQGILPFGEWRQRALAHAAANPTSSLARIAAVVDILTEDSAAAMIGASPVGRHVLGGTDYPVPPVDREYADRYISRIR
jgi:thioester reductase-like protein